MIRKNINHLELNETVYGNERKIDFLKEVLDNGTFLPKTVVYKDIDSDFKKWVEEKLKMVSDDGSIYPTMSLYSNQRFSEYMQSWKYTDTNNNLILNFKTVSRENNPHYGKVQNGYYNIPGDIYFTMKKKKVLDNNGSESFLNLKMKQPTAIDIVYKLSIFTTKYQDINHFNMAINKMFNSRQAYINPNGYYMPMILDSINDESKYEVDDRQFYSQTYLIKVLGYIITEDDFMVEEIPLKMGIKLPSLEKHRKKPEVEIEECEPYSPYYYKPIILTISYPICKINSAKFTIDTDFVCTDFDNINILDNFRIFVNGDEINTMPEFSFVNGDEIRIDIKKRYVDKESVMVLNGYNPNIVFDENNNNAENINDVEQDVQIISK